MKKMFKLVLEKAEEPEIKLPTSAGSSKKAREFQKNIYFCFVDYAKVFDCVGHNKLWKILKEIGIPDHLTFLLRSLCAGQEAAVMVPNRKRSTCWAIITPIFILECLRHPPNETLYPLVVLTIHNPRNHGKH